MCSNYESPSKSRLSLLDLHGEQLELEMDSHVYPLYPAPIIMKGADEFELDIAHFGLIPSWAKELKFGRYTYNARTETVDVKHSFRHAWKKSQFALVPVDILYEPKYINEKSHWYGIARADGLPFTVAAIYDDAVVEGKKIRSFSMLTINADKHPFMKQFHAPNDEKRSVIVIPEEFRNDWLSANFEDAREFFFEMPDEFVSFPKSRPSENPAQQTLL